MPLVIAALPKSEPFILLGESFAGPLAIMAAAIHPANLRGIILCATFAARPIPWIAWAVPVLANSLVFRLFPPAQQVKAILGGYSNPQLRELFAQIHAQVRPGVVAFRVRQVFRIDVRERLRACDVPMLCIAAAKDRVVPARNVRVIRRIKPEMTVVTIAGPHGIPQTRPTEAAAAIVNFAASLEEKAIPVST